MLDFMIISRRKTKKGVEVYPKFIVKKSDDLMIRGSDFYAIWDEERKIWSTDEQDALRLIDQELSHYLKEHAEELDDNVNVFHMWDAESGMIDKWHKYCQRQMRDSFHPLDEELIFSNTEVSKKNYASKRLNYPLEKGEAPAYEKLISTLYSKEERHKLEWAIGSIVSGDSKTIQKFMVLYGAAGSGKSTMLNIITQLFDGYYSVFDARALGSSNNAFALESFKANPLVAIQHDGDLSRIEDNTRLNSLVSHEYMTVNEKFKSTYTSRFKCFLFMGTNKPVKITDGKSGLIRRLIDVTPSGKKLSSSEYKQTVSQIPFELGAIAYHCKEVYLSDPGKYDSYIPKLMLGASNDFYNYIIDVFHIFKRDDGTSLKAAWELYKTYCDEANVSYPLSKRPFKEELKNYFREYNDRFNLEDGSRVRSYYKGFRTDIFDTEETEETPKIEGWLKFDSETSVFDEVCSDCPAQYASKYETPIKEWSKVKTTLKSLDTKKLHYVKVPEVHIVADFDLKDESGNKSLEKNIAAANKWPPTYAEISKGGEGIHLHYIYQGDTSELSRVYDEGIEIKVFTGGSSLRRKLTKCNDKQIAVINSGLPLKGADKVVELESILNEKALRSMIQKNLNKEYHPDTSSSINFINKLLDDMYNSGKHYDVSDMYDAIFTFAANSSNQAERCLKVVDNMHLKSDDPSENVESTDERPIVFFDIEIFPNLFLVNWKFKGEGHKVVRMINPKSTEIEELLKYRLIGFNCRRYDNHILYARLIGYSVEQLYSLSQKIIGGDRNAFFGEAYNLSYTDVYDFASTKKSLKKWEIELGIHHKELGLPWDKPVPEEKWIEVAEYCDNDVIATEAVFDHLEADFIAREILADVAGMTVNDTTNSLTTRIIFGKNRKPQDQFNYRFMGASEKDGYLHWQPEYDYYSAFDNNEKPHFPGYEFDMGKSTYRGEEVGEGGYVYAEPGMYVDVALLDIASMHPSSIIAENLFGDKYTARFKEIVDTRIAIKHGELDRAKTMLGGALGKYLDDPGKASNLAKALKIAINSVYGLTSAKFDNPFRDVRNIDNIVAKRGALFMVNLKHEVQKRGFTVAHIKTDSIKIPNATQEIIDFVMEYGKMYGYTFEHEATYERMCLVNDAVYIAKYKDGDWTATGKQFAVPYVFKTLFSKEPVGINDMRETFSVKSALYLDMNENLPDVSEEEKELDKLTKKLKKAETDEEKDDISKRIDELSEIISTGHNYVFVGRVGEFCPVKPGEGGGLLCREQNGKFYAATGTTGYRWLETEVVLKKNGIVLINDPETGDKKEIAGKGLIFGDDAFIDRSYYERLVDDAVETISKYGDFEWFVSDDISNKLPRGPIDPEIPFDPDYIDGEKLAG